VFANSLLQGLSWAVNI